MPIEKCFQVEREIIPMKLLIFQEPVYTEAKSLCPYQGPGENQRKSNF